MTPEFQEERLSGLGGSDAAAIAGENPYKSALQVYMEKVGLHKVEETEAMYWGTAIEPAIRTRYEKVAADRYGDKVVVIPPPLFYRHQKNDCLIAHPDGLMAEKENPFGVLEIKTANDRMRKTFGDPWTDEVPKQYLIQVQHYMGVLNLDLCHIAVLFGNREFAIYEVKRHPQFVDDLFALEVDFWENHIKAQIPPEPDASDSAKAMLAKIYPSDMGTEVIADGPTLDWVYEFRRQKEAVDAAESRLQECRNHIVAAIGEASLLTGPDFRITYKQDKPRETVDYKKAVAAILSDLAICEDAKVRISEHVHGFTETKPGSRRFLPKFDKE